MKKINYLLMALSFSIVLASCHKNTDTPQAAVAVTAGVYVANQGVFPSGVSTLSYYSLSSKQVVADEFNAANARTLGTTANDVEIYGSKTYIVVNGSSTVEVIDTKTAKSLSQIKFFNGTTARSPRSVAFYKNNAYVTSYDNTVAVIDTAALTISKFITVGSNPEELTVANGKLYVANSGGLGYPNFATTVSVVDLSTQTVTKTLTVVANPQKVVTDGNGNVYVLSFGNYSNIPASLAVIDANADVVKSQTNVDGNDMAIQGDNIFVLTNNNKIVVYSAKTQTMTSTNFITDGTVVTVPYCITVDSVTGEVFIGDAKTYTVNGTVYAFDKTGKLEYSFTAGVIPGKIALIKQ